MVRAHQQVLQHGHLGKEKVALRYVNDTRGGDDVGPPPRDLLAVHEYGARPRRQQARDGAKQRGLPVPVGTEDDDALAVFDREVDAMEDLTSCIARDETLDFKHR